MGVEEFEETFELLLLLLAFPFSSNAFEEEEEEVEETAKLAKALLRRLEPTVDELTATDDVCDEGDC